jgi:hypothetical protein
MSEREKEIADFKKGYDLGKKVEKAECERLCQEWNKLKRKFHPLELKPFEKMTKEEMQLYFDYELFWECKVSDKINLQEVASVVSKVASGFKKAVLEKCAEKK